jgi:hypothetical protein
MTGFVSAAQLAVRSRKMRVEEIRELLRKEPFLPFTLYVTDGRTFTIRHPEFVGLTSSSLIITLPPDEEPLGLPEQRAGISLLHVTGYLQKQSSAPVSSN